MIRSQILTKMSRIRNTGRYEVFPVVYAHENCTCSSVLTWPCTVVPYQNSLSVQVVWAVTDLGSVPKGSVLINPDTGTPYLNRKPDHTAYLYRP
jgi:hypothetical protein